MQIANDCCLDENSNSVCDADEIAEKECPPVTCPECEVCDGTTTQVVYKFICEDQRVVDFEDDCYAVATDFSPITTNEEGTPIKFVNLRPFCVDYSYGGNLYFSINRVSSNISVQVKTSPADEYQTVYIIPGTDSANKFFSFCDKCYKGDFRLKPDKVYLMRLAFDVTKKSQYAFEKYPQEVYYSNEHVIDARSGGSYAKVDCSQKFS